MREKPSGVAGGGTFGVAVVRVGAADVQGDAAAPGAVVPGGGAGEKMACAGAGCVVPSW